MFLFDRFFSREGESKKVKELRKRSIEELSDGRHVLDSREIINSDGSLWGYRVYKGCPNWDTQKDYPIDHPWTSQREWEQAVLDYIQQIETSGRNLVTDIWHIKNTYSVPEQMVFSHISLPDGRRLISSWTRDPETALVYSNVGENDGERVVLLTDVPKELAISAEVLIANTKEKEVRSIMEMRASDEKEITLFLPLRETKKNGISISTLETFMAKKDVKILPGALIYKPHFQMEVLRSLLEKGVSHVQIRSRE